MMEKSCRWALGPAMIAFAAMSTAGAVSVNYRDPGDVVGMRPEYVLDGYSSVEPPSNEIIDPVGAYNPTKRVIRSQHNQFGHGLRYHTIAQYSLENLDNTAANTYESFRFAIHLRPPQSFGGRWK